MESEYIRVIINLFAVLVLIFSLVLILKKVKFAKLTNSKGINVIHTLPIGTKEKLLLVEVNNIFLLLGSTANQVATLHVFDKLTDKQIKHETSYEEVAGAIKLMSK